MYLVVMTEKIYDEDFIIKEMLATGEYGVHGHPISHEAILEYIRDREWGLHDDQLPEYISRSDVPVQISIKDEEGTDLYYKEYGVK